MICSHSALFNAGAADDPLIVRPDDFLEVGIGDDALRRIRPSSENYGIRQDVALPSETAWLKLVARRYSLRAAQAERKFFFLNSRKALIVADLLAFLRQRRNISQNKGLNSFLKRAQLDKFGARRSWFMVHAIIFAAVALFALIAALTA